jgi:hypothetical protein
MNESVVRKFWELVDKRGPEECWPWKGNRLKDGYGRRGNAIPKAHRFSYEIAHGVMLSRETLVRHTCDNPPCCNPAHLLIGTPLDNMVDKRVRGRAGKMFGECHGNAVLTDAEVEEVRRRYDAGDAVTAIARSFPHASYGGVWAIAKRLTRNSGSYKTGGRLRENLSNLEVLSIDSPAAE